MNWLDQAIAWVSPKTGLQRARARAAMGLARSYEGAGTGRRTQGWSAGGTSANAEIYSGGTILRQRVRDLVRNDAYAARAIAALVANAIGTGITADSTTPAGKVWKSWVTDCDFYGELDFYGLQALVARTIFESGECLIVRQRIGAAEMGPSGVPLKIKVLEPDYLDSTKNGPQNDGGFAYSGIVVDKQGRRAGYWLWLQHPGDMPSISTSLKSVFIPARDVIHAFEKLRPGQLRGVTRLASVILQLRDLNEYNEALLIKKKVEACFSAFVTSDDETRTITPGATTTTETAADGSTYNRRVETLGPGIVEYLRPGEEITFGAPSSVAGAGEFETGAARRIAMGAGLTYEILTGDLSHANYSSMRAGRQEFKALIEQFRWLVFIPQVCATVQDWFEEAAWLSGRVRARGYDFTWTPPHWEYVNPLDDVKTDKEELTGGLSSWSAQIRKRGEDPAKVLEEIKADQQKFIDAGVPYPIIFESQADAPPAPAGETPPPQPARSIAEEFDGLRAELIDAMRQQPAAAPSSITVNVPPPEVRIERLDLSPIVNIPAPEVRVEVAAAEVAVPAAPKVTRTDFIRDPVTQEIISSINHYEIEAKP